MRRVGFWLRRIQGRLAQFEDLAQLQLALEPTQRPQQVLLDLVEIAAQGKLRQRRCVGLVQGLQALRGIVAIAFGQDEILRQLAGRLGLLG